MPVHIEERGFVVQAAPATGTKSQHNPSGSGSSPAGQYRCFVIRVASKSVPTWWGPNLCSPSWIGRRRRSFTPSGGLGERDRRISCIQLLSRPTSTRVPYEIAASGTRFGALEPESGSSRLVARSTLYTNEA
ncbi:hypothetical protein GGTG_06463 [Gaeumannomyces tritici R3-111a-1]|uniref:Uncharacterized protein n=1 Tax=Gaeumannomyces tritici (strain R3-111a-1) TaxID=644352 RepID=J3NYW1_GAET3|nr:hypothetical protein GGTG_06463 [Gaeumannomyces tritici R3-111a-1]EJT76544.1 hypothetical protein GGTG_06463 [Gaeumannomyces tritici R3-111a-1]